MFIAEISSNMPKRIVEDGNRTYLTGESPVENSMSAAGDSISQGTNKRAKVEDGAELFVETLANGKTPVSDETGKAIMTEAPILASNTSHEERKQRRKEKKRGKRDERRQNEVSRHPAVDSISNIKETEPRYKEHPALSALSQTDIDDYLNGNFISTSSANSEKTDFRPVTEFSYLSPTPEEARIFKSYTSPTPIQALAWPFLLAGQDTVGVAETGSGKTLAYGIPLVRYVTEKQSSKSKARIRAVVVAPTRELALQIHEQIEELVSGTNLRSVCVYGGVPKDEQRPDIKQSHIVIATPGRLNDFIQEGSADLSHVSFVVLDEADRMLEKGFEDEVRKILESTAKNGKRQTSMFTATWPPSIRDLAASFMTSPVRINIGENNSGELRANSRVAQQVEVIDPMSKDTRLVQILKRHHGEHGKNDRILVFCLYKKEAARMERFLGAKGFRVGGIHGDMNQAARIASLEAFRNGQVPVLVATDVAARGLDIPSVKLVINVTFPLTAEDYVHRIGRTGRAGKEGLAITLFTIHDKALSGALINVLRAAKQPVPEELLKFGGTVKRKTHDLYGAFHKDTSEVTQQTKKITFD